MKIFFFLFALPNISQNDGKFMKSVESYNSTEKGNTGHHVWSSFHLFIEGGKAWLGVVTQEAADRPQRRTQTGAHVFAGSSGGRLQDVR